VILKSPEVLFANSSADAEQTKGWDCVVTYSLKELNTYLSTNWPKGHCHYVATTPVDEYGIQCQFQMDLTLVEIMFWSQDNGYLDMYMNVQGQCDMFFCPSQGANVKISSYTLLPANAVLEARIPLWNVSVLTCPPAQLVS
jgi:hypothetical protein